MVVEIALKPRTYQLAVPHQRRPVCYQNWPKSPIWPEDLALIRQLLTAEEYAELLRRMLLPNGPLLDYRQAFGEPSTN